MFLTSLSLTLFLSSSLNISLGKDEIINMLEVCTSHLHTLWYLVFPVIIWRKCYYSLLQRRILNIQMCDIFIHNLTFNATRSWNSNPLLCFELYLMDFSYSHRHVFIFKTDQNITFGSHRIIYLHLLALWLYSIYKLPVRSGKYLHFCALI